MIAKIILLGLLGGALGGYLSHLGHSYNTKEYWIIMLLAWSMAVLAKMEVA